MTMHFTSREFNQDVARAKRAAANGPVFITDRGRPAHVLLTAQEYQRLSSAKQPNIVELLAGSGEVEEFDPPRMGDRIFRPVDFDDD